MTETMLLIAGRSNEQGRFLNAGKRLPEHLEATATVEVNADDMARLGLASGDPVRRSTAAGDAVMRCQRRKAKNLPAGLLFIPCGRSCGQPMDADTAGSGLPAATHLKVPVADPLSADPEQDP